jgi:hypothetical protein
VGIKLLNRLIKKNGKFNEKSSIYLNLDALTSARGEQLALMTTANNNKHETCKFNRNIRN